MHENMNKVDRVATLKAEHAPYDLLSIDMIIELVSSSIFDY